MKLLILFQINDYLAISDNEIGFGYADSIYSKTFCSFNSDLAPKRLSSTDTKENEENIIKIQRIIMLKEPLVMHENFN